MSVLFNNQHNLEQQGARIRQHGRRIGEKDKRSNEGNLLVFGYACNIYFDENKAVYFDEGKHLIPWMGDESLMIDRYDGRLLLGDLSQFVSRGLPGELSEDELEMERQCDQERYLALEESTTDKEYEEEEMKRFKAAIASESSYSAVGLSYDQYYPPYNYNYESTQENAASATQYYPYPEQQTVEAATEEPEQSSSAQDVHVKEQEIEVFVPPEELGVPDTMEVPDTTKLHVIIERTAFFIKDHGPQMEIVVKAKQSGNQQFDFLQFDHRLNPYYKLILKAVRSGTYEPTSSKPPSPPTPPPEEDDDSEDSDGDFELHPLLTASLRTPIVSTKKQNPTIPYSEQPLPPGWTVVTTDANAWERYHSSDTGTDLPFPSIDGVSMAMSYAPGYLFQPHSQTNPFLPPPPPPGESPPRIVDPETHPLFDMHHPSLFPAGMPVDMYPGNRHGPGTYFPAADTANYIVNVGPPIIPPPPDLKPICDKLAEYAARNGRQFEENIRAKGDPRFDFLNHTSDHYTYYQMKRKEFEQNPSKSSNTSTPGGPSKSSPLVPSNKPVSFQIKVKDAKRTVIEYRSSVLFKTAKADESDEEETNEESSKDDQSKEDSSQNGESAVSQPDIQGPKTQEDVMAEERTTKLKEEQEKEVQRLEEEAKSTTSSLRRQVQLERRRRAQLFINMLKKTTPSSEQSASNQSNADPN